MKTKYPKIFLILIIFVFTFFVDAQITKAEKLPECDLSFYNIKITELRETNSVIGDINAAVQEGTDWNYTVKNLIVKYNINKKNVIEEFNFIITEEHEVNGKKEDVDVCKYTFSPDAKLKGVKLGFDIIIKENKSTNGKTTCKGGEWKYGHISKMKFSGKYKRNTGDGDGALTNYKTETIAVHRCGQFYGTNRTEKTTAKTDKNGNLEKTTIKNNADSLDDASDKISKYSTKKNAGLTGKMKKQTECDEEIQKLIDKYWKWLTILAPVALILLITIDFLKAVVASDENQLSKSANNALKRTIAVVVLLVLPALLKMILGWFGLNLCF